MRHPRFPQRPRPVGGRVVPGMTHAPGGEPAPSGDGRGAGHGADGSLVVFGGTSDIGLAVAAELLAAAPRPVVLVCRPGAPRVPAARRAMLEAGATRVRIVDLDVAELGAHEAAVAEALAGPVDRVVLAFGVLGDQERAWQDAGAAVTVFTVNATAAVSIGVLVAQRLRGQARATGRRGRIIAISSVAAERVRRPNFVYGASKAGMDGFFTGLREALRPDGIGVLVVRPGFVRSAMTAGRSMPLAVDPRRVGRAVAEADERGRELVRVPAVFGPVMTVFRLMPQALARRMPW